MYIIGCLLVIDNVVIAIKQSYAFTNHNTNVVIPITMLPVEIWELIASCLDCQDDRLSLQRALGRPYIRISFTLPLLKASTEALEYGHGYIIKVGNPDPYMLYRLRQNLAVMLYNMETYLNRDTICIGVIQHSVATVKVSTGFTDLIYNYDDSGGFTDLYSYTLIWNGRKVENTFLKYLLSCKFFRPWNLCKRVTKKVISTTGHLLLRYFVAYILPFCILGLYLGLYVIGFFISGFSAIILLYLCIRVKAVLS